MNDLITTTAGRAKIVRASIDEQTAQLIDLIVVNLAASSQRFYRHTYQRSREFAAQTNSIVSIPASRTSRLS